MSGDWVKNALGMVAREVLKATVGGGSTSHTHLKKRQGEWPKLSRSTLADKRKKVRKIFVFGGRVAKAVAKRPVEGKLLNWGKGEKRPLRYVANGIYAAAGVNKDGFWMATGFAGKLKHSKGFQAKRKELAIGKGVKLGGLSAGGRTKAINAAVSVTETRKSLKGTGVKKFAAMGSLGKTDSGKSIMARGSNNLAYADIVQAGAFKGIESGGRLFKPQEIAIASRKGQIGKDFKEVRGKKPRQLLPYDQGDVAKLQQAMETGVSRTLKREFA